MEVEIYRFQNLIAKMCFISDLVHIIDSIHFLSFHSLCVCCVRLDLNRIYSEIEINIRNGSLLQAIRLSNRNTVEHIFRGGNCAFTLLPI